MFHNLIFKQSNLENKSQSFAKDFSTSLVIVLVFFSLTLIHRLRSFMSVSFDCRAVERLAVHFDQFRESKRSRFRQDLNEIFYERRNYFFRFANFRRAMINHCNASLRIESELMHWRSWNVGTAVSFVER